MGGHLGGGVPVGGKIVEWGDDDGADASVSVLSSSRSEENLAGM